MKPNFAMRRKKIRNLMGKKGIDAIITSNHNDIFYYTGYSGLKEDSIFLIIPMDGDPKVIVTSLENEAGKKYKNVVFMNEIKDFMDQLKGFRKIGYDEKSLKVILYKEMEKLKAGLEPVGKMMEIPRMVKEPHEIDEIRKAVRITGKVFSRAGNLEGKKETDVANWIDIEFRKEGVVNSFESIVSSGLQSAFVHHKPNGKVIKRGEGVLMDIGCRFGMYCSDLTRMFFPGRMGKKQKEAYEDVKEIHNALIDSMEAGETCKEIEKLQDRLFRKKGYRVFHNFGHGVGLSVHDPTGNVLNRNMVLTVEPGIYLKNYGGFRIEDMILIKKGKAELLSGSIPVI